MMMILNQGGGVMAWGNISYTKVAKFLADVLGAGFVGVYWSVRASLVAQMVKNLPAMREIWIQSLGWKDPLKKEMATHSSILSWRILWTEEPGGLQSMGSQRVRHNWVTGISSIALCNVPFYPWQYSLFWSHLASEIIMAIPAFFG